MDKSRIRTFIELDADEQDVAVQRVFEMHSNDYESGKIELIGPLTEEELQATLWANAGAIAASACYIPDDGSLIVRI